MKRLALSLSLGIALAGTAFAQTEQFPMLGKGLDPRYAPHPSGGSTREFAIKYAAAAARGESWRVASDCASACTMGFGHFSKHRICIAPGIKLGFHYGSNERATAQMWGSYPADIKLLINSSGGMRREWLWIPASAFHKLGYRVC